MECRKLKLVEFGSGCFTGGSLRGSVQTEAFLDQDKAIESQFVRLGLILHDIIVCCYIRLQKGGFDPVQLLDLTHLISVIFQCTDTVVVC